MQRVGFKMQLLKGFEEEYKRRHNAIWPEMKVLLKESGIKDYSIFLDDETNLLFGYFVISDTSQIEELPKHPVMQKWWTYMKDIMETNDDHSPVNIPLKEVFYLP
ncbi:MAG: L-rhamnose mutarotase [Chitinophagaceae bacterium]